MTPLQPRFEDLEQLLIAGLGGQYTPDDIAGIPAQWDRFDKYLGHIEGQVGSTCYGVCRGNREGFEYIAGVEVSDFSQIPADFTRLRLPKNRYAVFTHQGPIAEIATPGDSSWTSGSRPPATATPPPPNSNATDPISTRAPAESKSGSPSCPDSPALTPLPQPSI
jgi:predicted transcriptional regulator YdeE